MLLTQTSSQENPWEKISTSGCKVRFLRLEIKLAIDRPLLHSIEVKHLPPEKSEDMREAERYHFHFNCKK